MRVGRDHRQHVVLCDDLVILVRDLGVPAHLAVARVAAQGLLLAGEPHGHRVVVIERRQEAQIVDAVIREHGPEIGIDEQPRRERHDQVAVRDAALEERVLLRGFLVHVRIEGVAGKRGEVLDVVQRHLL